MTYHVVCISERKITELLPARFTHRGLLRAGESQMLTPAALFFIVCKRKGQDLLGPGPDNRMVREAPLRESTRSLGLTLTTAPLFQNKGAPRYSLLPPRMRRGELRTLARCNSRRISAGSCSLPVAISLGSANSRPPSAFKMKINRGHSDHRSASHRR